MRTPNYNIRIAGFTLAVIIGMVGLGFLPPFTLCGMEFCRVDILSELRDSDSAVEIVEDYTPDFELLEQEIAVAEAHISEADTIAEPTPVRYEWIVSEAPKREPRALRSEEFYSSNSSTVEIEDFDTLATTRLDNFITKLANGESVRIAFMGDSFVEGDILTGDLREELQSRFGGRGVGFVTADIPFTTVRKSVKRASSGWNTHSVMKRKNAPEALRDRFYISGYIAEGGAGATTRWRATDAFPSLDSCTTAHIILISRDSSRIEVAVCDTLRHEFAIEGDERVRDIYIEAPADDIRVRVIDGNIICYGVSMEDNCGVTVDNFSVRSNNGHAIFGTSATVNRQIDEILNYDLVVLQYGLNIMQQGQRGYSKYRDQLRDMIAYAERCFPNAAIMVMGVSDRWVKSAETGAYEPIGSVDALTSYQRAAADSCKVAFWNTSQVMSNLGGMPTFVANGWAAKDYTHINFIGGRHIAKALSESIMCRVYYKLCDMEQERRIEAERIRRAEHRRRLEAEERLNNQINAVAPIIDSMGWHSGDNEEVNTNNTEE